MNKKFKNIYFLSLAVIGLLVVVLSSSYALFTNGTELSSVGLATTSSFTLNLGEVVEYKRISLQAKSSLHLSVKVKNTTSSSMNFGIWYEMIEPSVNGDIEIYHTYTGDTSIASSVTNTLDIYVINRSSSAVSLDIGCVGSSSTVSVEEPKYLITYKEEEIANFANYLVDKSNAASVTNYSDGDSEEMYVFSQEATTQTTALTDYRYIGSSPNNYVYFNCTNAISQNSDNCEVWRIVGVFPVEDGNGNIENRVKLISGSGIVDGNGISKFVWDYKTNSTGLYGITNTTGVNQWGESVLTTDSSTIYPGADLMLLLNSGAYYNRTTGDCITYDSSSKTFVTSVCNFSDSSNFSKGLSYSAKSVIGNVKYYLGSISSFSDLNGDYNSYVKERSLNTWTSSYDSVVRTSNWIGEVGLMYLSDYIYVYGYGVDNTCFNEINSCVNFSNSWIYNSNDKWYDGVIYHQWFINNKFSDKTVYMAYDSGKIDGSFNPYNVFSVRPTVYLDANVNVSDGDGSESNPYQIEYTEYSAADYLISKANSAKVTTYSAGNTGEMYTFSQTAGTQQSGWTSEQLVDYRYIGDSPNNYVYFNCPDVSSQNSDSCDVWRIIGVFSVDDGRGNIEQRLKLITDTGISAFLSSGETSSLFSWDSSALADVNEGKGINQWGTTTLSDGTAYAGADLMQLLNGAFLAKNTGNCYVGSDDSYYLCNFVYDSVYIKYLKNFTLRLIGNTKYYLGGLPYNTTSRFGSGSDIYVAERGTAVYAGTEVTRTTSWTGKVALMYPSDYVYSFAYGVDDICFNNNYNCRLVDGSTTYGDPSKSWIHLSNDRVDDGVLYHQWLLGVMSSDTAYTAMVIYYSSSGTDYGRIGGNSTASADAVRPVVYLNSDVQILAGDGSSENPYQLVY